MNIKLSSEYLYRFILCLTSILVIVNEEQVKAQSISPLANSIIQAEAKQLKFQKIDAFTQIQTDQKMLTKDKHLIKDLVRLDLMTEVAQFVVETKPQFIIISLPLTNGVVADLLLEKQELFDVDARLTTQSDSKGIPIQGGSYYQGIIKGDFNSLVAISFFENEVIGVISNHELGNLVLGKFVGSSTENASQHVLYRESSLPIKNPFQCGVEENLHDNIKNKISDATELVVFPNRCKSVKIFLECDYKLFQDRGSSKNAVEAYITGLFNVVKALYAVEKVNIEISEIMVWTTQDPYLKTTLANIIYDYANRRGNNFKGTLAQLVTTFPIQQQGGIAFVDGMCKTWDGQSGPLSFAFIHNQYSTLPTYSWSVEVMAHEMGHNFGSWHTHSCVWGPNKNAQIDNCQPADIGSCNNGVAPIGGGTIMSYCHLTNYGITFSKGFGTEPGDILRNAALTKPCIPSSFTPLISTAIKGPYFEGDSVKLAAKPYNKNYQYEWFHYDYIKNKNSDTSLTVKQSGIYTLAISNTSCTEYSTPDTIKFNDFVVNLGCPIIPGKRDSFYSDISLQIDNANYSVDTLDFPSGLYALVPKNALDVLVELQMTITPRGSSFTRSVVSKFESPASIGIVNNSYTPNDQIPFGQKSATTFTRLLGNFDPAGQWIFSGIDSRADAGIDATVIYKIVLSWRMRDSVIVCDIPLCDNKDKKLDAGITNANYFWTNGANTKTISSNQLGQIGVTATKGNRSSSHSVNLILTNTKFMQNLTICDGSFASVGNKKYNKAGTYIDTFKSVTGCDSILSSIIEIKPIIKTTSEQFKCYKEKYKTLELLRDTSISITASGSNGCDSIHTINFSVNPELIVFLNYEKKCNDIGTELIATGEGGTGTLIYSWQNGSTDSTLSNVKSGIYSVTIMDEKNCSNLKQIKVENYDSITVNKEIKDVQCFGDKNGEITLNVLTGTPPYIYNWSNGNHDSIIAKLNPGKYTIIIFDANGCRLEENYEILSPDLLFVNADVKPSFGNNGSIELMVFGGKSPYKYKWNNADTSQNIYSLIPGTYSVEIIDANGCISIQTYEVQNKVAVNDYSRVSKVQIQPNPFNSLLSVNSLDIGIKSVEIKNMNAQFILEKQFLHEQSIKLNLSDLPFGNYMLSINLVDGKTIHRLIVKTD